MYVLYVQSGKELQIVEELRREKITAYCPRQIKAERRRGNWLYVERIIFGGEYSAIITADNTLYMCGLNDNGQIGDGTTTRAFKPVKVMDNVANVSLGGTHSAAITTNGELYMWGYNSHGQLGNGTTDDSYVPIKIMDNIADVSLGDVYSSYNGGYEGKGGYSAAVTIDGELYMWGYESYTPIKVMDNVADVCLGTEYESSHGGGGFV